MNQSTFAIRQDEVVLLQHRFRSIRELSIDTYRVMHNHSAQVVQLQPMVSAFRLFIQDQDDLLEALKDGAFLLDGVERYLESLLRDRTHQDQRIPQNPQYELLEQGSLSESTLESFFKKGVTLAFIIHLLAFVADTLRTVVGQYALRTFLEYQVGFNLNYFHTLGSEPWKMLIPGGPIISYWQMQQKQQIALGEHLRQRSLPDLLKLLEHRLGVRRHEVEHLTTTLVLLLKSYGIADRATLYRESILSPRESASRKQQFLEEAARHNRGVPKKSFNSHSSVLPEHISNLMLNLVELDMMGAQDEAVIRILTDIEEQGKVVLMFPSTQKWFFPSRTPNDLLGNVELLRGGSAMVQNGYEALMEIQEQNIPLTEILIMGFSQGGMAGFAFAQRYADELPIKQVITFGSPVGKFRPVDESISALSFEFENDPVPKLDGTKNAVTENQHTFVGTTGNHNLFEYMDYVDEVVADPENFQHLTETQQFQDFLQHEYEVHDFYARRTIPEPQGQLSESQELQK